MNYYIIKYLKFHVIQYLHTNHKNNEANGVIFLFFFMSCKRANIRRRVLLLDLENVL